MLYGLLMTFFVILCFLLITIILIQKSKSSLGLSSISSSSQILFGGSGGQDLFQKATWIMIALFMGGSLGLALLKNAALNNSRYLGTVKPFSIEELTQDEPTAEQAVTTEQASQNSSTEAA